jgi:predicted SAM-dependent methyltransferase
MDLNRNEKILFSINKNGVGIEVGPSHAPVAPKKMGYHVHIIDHACKAELIVKYQNEHTENIEDVDFIWSGESYAELTGKTDYYDWLIASHVIEHVPDFIGFLNGCGEVLKNDGVLSLAVPDMRYCFDACRASTGISKIIDAFTAQRKTHSLGTAIENYLNFVVNGKLIAWNDEAGSDFNLMFEEHDALAKIESFRNANDYVDFHAWCFTPSSFRLLIQDLNLLGYISLKEITFFPTAGHEFFVTLSKGGKGSGLDRITLLNQARNELSETQRLTTQQELGKVDNFRKRLRNKVDRIFGRKE